LFGHPFLRCYITGGVYLQVFSGEKNKTSAAVDKKVKKFIILPSTLTA